MFLRSLRLSESDLKVQESVPGPACYGKGGSEATVTDANAVLGYLPAHLLGGTFALDIEGAKKAVQQVANSLGVSLYEAAEGILKVSNETMSAKYHFSEIHYLADSGIGMVP